MKPYLLPCFFLFPLLVFGQGPSKKNTEAVPLDFHLSYYSVGLGSNFGSMQPVFKVEGSHFIYTSEQTSFYQDQPRQKTDTLLTGDLLPSGIEQIRELVKEMHDTLVYKTNVQIRSGGLQEIHIQFEKTDLTFRLHNASDPIAQKIIDVLNAYIPNDQRKLWLFDL